MRFLFRRFVGFFVSVPGLSKTSEIEPLQTNSILFDPASMMVACFFGLGAAKGHALRKPETEWVSVQEKLIIPPYVVNWRAGVVGKPLLFGLRTSRNYRLEFSAKPYVLLSQPLAKMERILHPLPRR